MRILFLASAGMILASCGGGDGTEPDDTSVTDTDSDVGDDDDDVGDDDDDTTTVETTANLSGVITDENGSPVGGANIRFCRGEQCRYAVTESDGLYEFDETAVAPQSFEVVPPLGGGMATAFAPLTFASNEVRVVDVMVPSEAAAANLPAGMTELTLGALRITMGGDDLTAPIFVDEATEASATLVQMDDWLPTDTIDGTVLAMWYLMPFDHHSDAGMEVRFDLGSMGLDGAEYKAYLGDYKTSTWLDIGTVTDGGGGIYDGAEIDHLSTIILVDES